MLQWIDRQIELGLDRKQHSASVNSNSNYNLHDHDHGKIFSLLCLNRKKVKKDCRS